MTNSAGVIDLILTKENACWVDGDNCPYTASTCNKFIDAPIALCAECHRLNLPKVEELFDFINDRDESNNETIMEENIKDEFLSRTEPIADIVKKLAQDKSEFIQIFSEIIIEKLDLKDEMILRKEYLEEM